MKSFHENLIAKQMHMILHKVKKILKKCRLLLDKVNKHKEKAFFNHYIPIVNVGGKPYIFSTVDFSGIKISNRQQTISRIRLGIKNGLAFGISEPIKEVAHIDVVNKLIIPKRKAKNLKLVHTSAM